MMQKWNGHTVHVCTYLNPLTLSLQSNAKFTLEHYNSPIYRDMELQITNAIYNDPMMDGRKQQHPPLRPEHGVHNGI